jgi:hypothetical protein
MPPSSPTEPGVSYWVREDDINICVSHCSQHCGPSVRAAISLPCMESSSACLLPDRNPFWGRYTASSSTQCNLYSWRLAPLVLGAM